MKQKKCPKCNGSGIRGGYEPLFEAFLDYECEKCRGKGHINDYTNIKQFLIYLFRWQLSTPILALCLSWLPFNTILNTIVANLIGGIIFFWIDKRIFKKEDNHETN